MAAEVSDHNEPNYPDRCPGAVSWFFAPVVPISALNFFTPTAFILALFPGACAFAYDRGVRFPAFFQLTSFLMFFLYRATHITIVCRPRVWPTGDVAPQCVNKRIFQQSICAACVYVGNLLAENRK